MRTHQPSSRAEQDSDDIRESTSTANPGRLPTPSGSSRDHILRLPQVRQMTGLSRSSIYALQKSHHFPHSIRLTLHAVGWLESEVRAWLAPRIERRESCQALRGTAAGNGFAGDNGRKQYG